MSTFIRTMTLAAALIAAPAFSNALIAPGPTAGIAKSRFSAAPASEWNRLSARASKKTETWTLDGPDLNRVMFFGGVAVGEPLFREVDKKRQPLPRVTANMLITDIPVLLETSYRSQGRVSTFNVDTVEPATVGGHKGVRFTYRYVGTDDVERKGEAMGAVVASQLYLTTYEAPAIYFFDRDLAKFRQLASTLKM